MGKITIKIEGGIGNIKYKIDKKMCQEEFENVLNKFSNNIFDFDVNCADFKKITLIPNIPFLKILYCRRCTNLKQISNIETFTLISCENCKKLEYIPEFKNLEILNCRGCVKIISLPNLENLTNLYYDKNNIKEENIGYLPKIMNVNYQAASPEFKQRNEYYHKLRLVKSALNNLLKKQNACGFTDDLIRLLQNY